MTLKMLNTIHDILEDVSISSEVEADTMIIDYMENASIGSMKEVWLASGNSIFTDTDDDAFKTMFRKALPDLWGIISEDLEDKYTELIHRKIQCDDVLAYLDTYDFK